MKYKKRVLIIFFIFVLFNLESILGLGISPAKFKVNFKPGLELEYSFNVEAGPNQNIELYSAGEFSDLVEFNKNELKGGGNFNVKIKLPNEISIPGKHTILIGARELNEKEGTVGTSIAVQVPIVIIVPYPGKYAEITFFSNNANVGEEINFQISVASQGHEPIFATADIEIYSGENKIETLNLGTKTINNQESYVFVKSLDTINYKPGDYNAIAIVNYQVGIARVESGFRIGRLFVNLTNYTKEIVKEGIKPFEINIESLWNDPIENIYSEVNVLQENVLITNFLTPSVSLEAWEKKQLIGYLDTGLFEIGEYDVEIEINYYGNSSFFKGNLRIIQESGFNLYLIIGIIFIVIILILLIFYFKFIYKKNVKK